MKATELERRVRVPVPASRLWDWHMGPGAFERLAPPWQRMVPVDLPDVPVEGALARFQLRKGPVAVNWHARIGPVEAPYRFVDTQEKGPFRSWRHEHRMVTVDENRADLVDSVRYALPSAIAWIPGLARLSRKELDRLFTFRHRRMRDDLNRFPSGLPGNGRTVLISGSRGLIGSRLVPYLKTLGYRVRGLTRGPTGGDLFHWKPAEGMIDPQAMNGVDMVIHLAGENIASGRWTASRRDRIMRSRVDGTRTLVEAMRKAGQPPSVMVCASGVNYYASGSGEVDEADPAGTGFLSEVCQRWEAEAAKAGDHGIRTVFLRTGVVLDPSGGALGKMLPAFLCGAGGPIGSGRQHLPWIAMDDLLDIYEQAIRDDSIRGPVNAVHPQQVTQHQFSKVLAAVLRRPAVWPLPAFMVKILFGRMGEETLLADLPVTPRVLSEAKHAFRFTGLHEALAFMLGRPIPSRNS